MKRILKRAYDLFPFKKQAFLAIRYFYRPPQTLYQRLSFDGPFRVKCSKEHFMLQNYAGHDHVIENEIFWTGLAGGWEKASLALWIELCKTSAMIFDIGANTGIYSLLAKAVHPKSTVYAFEPIPHIYRQLQRNIRLNNFDILGCDVAVSNRDGIQKIFDGAGGHTYTASLNRGFDQNSVELDVQTTTLSTFIRGHNIPAVDLMKIDVETHEAEALAGMEEYLGTMMPTMLIEILTDDIGTNVERLLRGMGYRYFAVDEEKGPTKVEGLKAGSCRNFLICSSEKAKALDIL